MSGHAFDTKSRRDDVSKMKKRYKNQCRTIEISCATAYDNENVATEFNFGMNETPVYNRDNFHSPILLEMRYKEKLPFYMRSISLNNFSQFSKSLSFFQKEFSPTNRFSYVFKKPYYFILILYKKIMNLYSLNSLWIRRQRFSNFSDSENLMNQEMTSKSWKTHALRAWFPFHRQVSAEKRHRRQESQRTASSHTPSLL